MSNSGESSVSAWNRVYGSLKRDFVVKVIEKMNTEHSTLVSNDKGSL